MRESELPFAINDFIFTVFISVEFSVRINVTCVIVLRQISTL